MADEVRRIRTVTVEFLRKGPPHNQLLSPLTEYLGVCGDAGAGPVSVPYEQAVFNALLDEMRYVDFDEQRQAPRQRALRTLGRDIGEVLGAVPGFTGSLVEHDSLLNLRIVASASELARLPFELAKLPSGAGRSTNEWLAVQSATPVCITRRSRTVQTQRARWHISPRPRVLFIVGLDIPVDLARQHRDALMDALAPWDTFQIDHESYSEDCLVEMGPFRGETPTVEAIRKELKSGYSFVHILAHGAESQEAEALTYGLYLPAAGDPRANATEEVSDVVTGERFASILSSIPRKAWPSVVFTATCDSANEGDLLVPGGNFAQALHEAGVPLVVASQFPLTTEGSVTLTRAFYEDLFWGDEPLPILLNARAQLHAEYGHTHDWASLVIYDGLPSDLHSQVTACRYERAKRALRHAQDVIEGITKAENTRFDDPFALATRALELLPKSPGFEREREGLIASHAKILAVDSYAKGKTEKSKNRRRSCFAEARGYFVKARRNYHSAARGFIDPKNSKQLHATVHWVFTQAIFMDRLLGSEADLTRTGRRDADLEDFETAQPQEWQWILAFQSAVDAVEVADDEIWAHGSLAELWLLKLCEDLDEDEAKRAAELAEIHASRVLQLSDPVNEHREVRSTKRQMQRYVQLFTSEFRKELELPELTGGEKKRWKKVRDTAQTLVSLLSPFDN